EAIRTQCAAWHLRIVGEVAHGSNAVVVPVTRDGEWFALRMTPPGPDVAAQVHALRFWDGQGMVRLYEHDQDTGAMLLEWLPSTESLRSVSVDEAMSVLGLTMRRLAKPAPPDVPSTSTLVADRSAELEREWQRLARPFDAAVVAEATAAAARLVARDAALPGGDSGLAVDGDLHSEQVLRASREPWLAIDPVLLRGDIAHDLARVLWTRIDEMSDAAEIKRHFETVVRAAAVDTDEARDAVVFRTVDYWLWGLDAGLTDDPRRCARLIAAFR
ncbi:MAG TPA: aminoglycoside phosphotransferase family protein, partial [Micromonosporaceae bacterium]|nr:aminoglycoside phosphotransferase family protein [Micromonosporaceae bacterium]